MAEFFDDTDESQAAKIEEALAAVIGKHIPLSDHPDDLLDEEFARLIVATTLFSPTGFYHVWNVEKEEAKLDDLRRTARDLVDVYKSMHPLIRERMGIATEFLKTVKGYSDVRTLTDGNLPGLWSIFDLLPEMLEIGIRVGKDEIRRGDPSGRYNWQAINLINWCRKIWSVRTGVNAPKSLNPASPFGKFVEDVFDASGVDANPQAAMAAWKQVDGSDLVVPWEQIDSYDENTD